MKVVVCGNFGVSNLGDEAIREGIELLLARVYPGAETGVMGKGRLFPFGVRSLIQSLFSPKQITQPLKFLRSCDLFVLGGGLFTDEEGPLVSTLWILHGLAASFFRKRVWCLGVSVGKLQPYNRYLLKKLLGRSEHVFVRDSASQKLLQRWGIPNVLGPDMAFYKYKEFEPNTHLKVLEKYIVVSIRPFKNHDAILIKKIAQLCNKIVADFAFDIVLLPFQSEGQNDGAILNTILEQCDKTAQQRITIFEHGNSMEKIMTLLTYAELCLAMRLHVGIISLASGVPVIPIDYMSKVRNYWETFGQSSFSMSSQAFVDEIHKRFSFIIKEQQSNLMAARAIREKNVELCQLLEASLAKQR